MPEMNGPDREPEDRDKREFIKEKIVKQPLTRRQIACRFLWMGGLGAVFGVAAAAALALSSPLFQKMTGENEEETDSVVSIPRDEATAAASESPADAEEPSEPIEQQVEEAVSSYRFTLEDFSRIHAPLKELAASADKGIVTVHSVRHETDWFNNPVENTGYFSGAVIAQTASEYLILTTEEAVADADAIRVTFSDGTETDGTKKQEDRVSGLAVVSVRRVDVDETTAEKMEILTLGNSYQVKMGDVIVAVGSPMGVVHSADYGSVGYVARNVPVTDGTVRVMYADVGGNAPMGTFLLNMSGEIVGVVTDEYKNENTQNVTAAAGISDYKGIIERMSNGLSTAYLGIQGQEITEEMEAQGMPAGIYITGVAAGSPAYEAGIQNGDILVRLNSGEIHTAKELQSRVENLEAGTLVTVTVARKGIEEYRELEYQITVGAR
ncbi:MAG TPA: S1C family serine protease [Candidatus Lachnoclostridium pullistercoris]|uniref:S1C family serine protease n=1 Tax=Candidatus Lachnoclostridium pullistercoris TaxID=2838632 RepID=A0A9D2T6Z7_9FIRM|nr:S1C family serine protease [Candidatus Lachnoclostridium pullistercoris]